MIQTALVNVQKRSLTTMMRLLSLMLAAIISACGNTSAVAKPTDTNEIWQSSAESAIWQYPQKRQLGKHRAILNAPQIHKWNKFETFDGLVALEFFPEGNPDKRLFATVSISGGTELNWEKRLVTIIKPQIDSIIFNGTDFEHTSASPEDTQGEYNTAIYKEYSHALRSNIRKEPLDVPLDLFLASLADEVLSSSQPKGFNPTPPPIKVRYKPTILLHIPGDPFLQNLEATDVQIAVNANWPLLFDPQRKSWFLLYRDQWLTSVSLDGQWHKTRDIPAELNKLSPLGEHADLLIAVPAADSKVQTPEVLLARAATELIVIAGEPKLQETIKGSGLQFVNNTESALFHYEQQWYYLASGRWFISTNLNKGPWQLQMDLPPAFSEIPADHKMSFVRVSVAGTPEARMAALEAMMPRTVQIRRDKTPDIKVSYDGDPAFEEIDNTGVSRAVNSLFDVLLVDSIYYLSHGGVWYQAASPEGPWHVATAIPDEIYQIPPSSPSYAVTDVKVVSATETSVTCSHTDAYRYGTYVYYGVPVYSTGWYYWPYYGSYYYHYYPAYSHGHYYNNKLGRYSTHSVWYGPYGGYSYSEGYNQITGRYGYREANWDNDELSGYSEGYSPRTGISVKQTGYYSEDRQRAELERKVSKGDHWIETTHTKDYDDQWSETRKTTSQGGDAQMRRDWDEDTGKLTSSGSITGADGRTATVTGQHEVGKGTTIIAGSDGAQGQITRERTGESVDRQGEFTTREGQQLSSTTNRQSGKTTSTLESSSGAYANSLSSGRNRTTVGESASGDVYAARDGKVYKKTDSGWQHYDRQSNRWQSAGSTAANSKLRQSRSGLSTHKRQLNRDARIRRQGFNQAQRRIKPRTGNFRRSPGRRR